MKRNEFKKKLYLLAIIYLCVAAGIPLLLYFITSDWKISFISFSGCLILCLLAFLLHRLDDRYITGIVADLSRLTDMLMELEEREIFAETEDTLLSKLQSKVTRLVRILKNKNKQSEREHENIKELVSDTSHQLKTPISNLKMYSQFLEDETLPPEKRREYVRIIRLSVERLNFLSENMIKISRLESGLIQLDMQNQSLNETILKSVKDIYPKARQKQVEIIYREETQAILSHDRNWTAEAVFNCLDNAVKYAGTDSRIILSIRRLGMFTEISVEDENGSIPESEQAKIFKRFYRGKNSREIEGIGIGLYLSNEIAIRQGGYMNLKVTEKGNIFSIILYNNSQPF